jgi:UDP-3-O-[3-hydroxymyristoyl] glucosamine N-acyltransferase
MSEFTIGQLKSFLESTVNHFSISGKMDRVINHPASLTETDETSVAFIRSELINRDLLRELRGLVVCPPQFYDKNLERAIASGELTKVEIDDTEIVFYLILNNFFSEERSKGIHKTSYVESGATIDEDVTVGPNSFIASSVNLGYGVQIGSNCSLRNCTIGAESVIQDGVRIGGEALGAVQKLTGEWVDRISSRRVVIGNNVRIEENTVIQRGFLRDTVLGHNIRVGPSCSIGNGVQIGDGTLIAQGVVICGSVSIGSNARIWGNSSVREGTKIGIGTVVGLGAVVLKDLADGEVHIGNPAKRLD